MSTRKSKEKKEGGTYERFMAMTPAERAADVAKFDREDLQPGRPLSKADQAIHRRAAVRGARKKMGRPRIGKGAKMVPVTIERGLLKAADTFAKRHGLKRSQMFAQGLRLVMQHSHDAPAIPDN